MILAVAPIPSQPVWRYRVAALALIVAAAALRIVYLACWSPLDLAPDEAHYWDWSRHLDWCYYSKGPLVAYLIRAGCELFGPWSIDLTGNEMVAVRIPAVVCGSLLLASLYTLTVQVYRSDRLALGVVGLALTLPLISAGSSIMTIDAPYCCAWGWALVFGYQALFGRSSWAWPAAGVCIAIGVLAKHTMVLWPPLLGLGLLMTPALRPALWRPGFWVMTGIGALGGIPILAWNAAHGWVTLLHTQGHIGTQTERLLHPLGPLNYFGQQCAVLLGFWFLAWVRAMWTHRPTVERRPEVAYLWWMSVPIVVFFGVFSLKNGGGEPNWPITGYLSGMVLTAAWLAGELRHPCDSYRRLTLAGTVFFCGLGVVLTVLVHDPLLIQPALLRWAGPESQATLIRRLDPTCRLRGWRTLAAEVDRVRAQIQRSEGREPVLAGTWWVFPGELGFYGQGHPQAYSIGLALTDRHSQYDLWHPNPLDDPAAFRGQTFIVVGTDGEKLRNAFDQVEPTREVAYRENGVVISAWSLTVCRGYRGFRARIDADRH